MSAYNVYDDPPSHYSTDSVRCLYDLHAIFYRSNYVPLMAQTLVYTRTHTRTNEQIVQMVPGSRSIQ
ncbi:hypothetical protein BLOT_011709 [Blomia tropicalis]|nr:hypothetical protein BLOT_011709 [Blomia tropicalis]